MIENYKTIYLTPKEKKVLIWLIQGFTNNEIGKKENCSENCIKIHVSNIIKKFNAKNRAQLAYIVGVNHLTENLLA